jgi:pyruvate/2-oxoglutarate dehydrogenase complex dihydrolipoamide acyltransferase (E2) component
VSFSFDHRILDGATADAFVMDIKKRMEGWQ